MIWLLLACNGSITKKNTNSTNPLSMWYSGLEEGASWTYTHQEQDWDTEDFILDESTRIREVNLTGADLLGFRRSELLNLRFSNFISPESQDDFYLHQKRLFETETRQFCELKLKKKEP